MRDDHAAFGSQENSCKPACFAIRQVEPLLQRGHRSEVQAPFPRAVRKGGNAAVVHFPIAVEEHLRDKEHMGV